MSSPDFPSENPPTHEVQQEIAALFVAQGYEGLLQDVAVTFDGTCLRKDGVVVRIIPNEKSPSGLEIGTPDPERGIIQKFLRKNDWKTILKSNGKFALGEKRTGQGGGESYFLETTT